MSDTKYHLEKLKKYIEENSGNEHKVLKALYRLEELPVTVQDLHATGIGKFVNKLKQGDTVAKKSKGLVSKWKSVVHTSLNDAGGKNQDPNEVSPSAARVVPKETYHQKAEAANNSRSSSTKESSSSDYAAASGSQGQVLRSFKREHAIPAVASSVHQEPKLPKWEHVQEPLKRGESAGQSYPPRTLDRDGSFARGLVQMPKSSHEDCRLLDTFDVKSDVTRPRHRESGLLSASLGRRSFSSKLPITAPSENVNDISAHYGDKVSKSAHSEQKRQHDTTKSGQDKHPKATKVFPGECKAKVVHDGQKVKYMEHKEEVLEAVHKVDRGGKQIPESRNLPRIAGNDNAGHKKTLSQSNTEGNDRHGIEDAQIASKYHSDPSDSPADNDNGSLNGSDNSDDSGNCKQSFEDILAYDLAAACELAKKKKRKLMANHKSSTKRTASGSINSTSASKSAKVDPRSSQEGGMLTLSMMVKKAAAAGVSTAGQSAMPPPPVVKLSLSTADIIGSMPDINTVYKPSAKVPLKPDSADRHAAAGVMSTLQSEAGEKQNSRTKIYSGRKYQKATSMDSLFNLCLGMLMNNINAIGYVGDVPCSILWKILEKCTSAQLLVIEEYNPQFIPETDALWEKHSQHDFPDHNPREITSWREYYMDCQEERRIHLEAISKKVADTIRVKVPERKLKMAYLASDVKPPREVRRQQAKLGTASGTVKASIKAHAILQEERSTSINLAQSSKTVPAKTVAPLMKQAMKFAKGVRR